MPGRKKIIIVLVVVLGLQTVLERGFAPLLVAAPATLVIPGFDEPEILIKSLIYQ